MRVFIEYKNFLIGTGGMIFSLMGYQFIPAIDNFFGMKINPYLYGAFFTICFFSSLYIYTKHVSKEDEY